MKTLACTGKHNAEKCEHKSISRFEFSVTVSERPIPLRVINHAHCNRILGIKQLRYCRNIWYRTNYETKVSVFWNVKTCNPVKVNISFGGTYNHHLQGQKLIKARNHQEIGGNHSKLRAFFYWHEDVRNMILQNFGWILPDYTALHHKRPTSSQSLLWQLKHISLRNVLIYVT
jgi:hypothetical protein